MRVRFVALSSMIVATALSAGAQQPAAERVRAIAPPATPLPAEDASRDVTRFSFIVYGDTRGRHDGVALLPPASRKEDVKVLEDNATKLVAALG